MALFGSVRTTLDFKPDGGTNSVRNRERTTASSTTPVGFDVRRRVGFDTDRGPVTRFVVQLEYRIDDGWYEVVRFDHDPDPEHGHDVANEGVHVDVYRDEKRIRSEEIFPPMTPDNAFTFAEEHSAEHAKRYTQSLARRHGIENP